MNPCEPYEDLLSAQLDGELTARDQADLTAHLETCPHCRKYARDLQALHASLLTMAADPPDWMTDSILEEVKASPNPAKKARRWAPLACAAVLALVLLGSAPLLFGSDPAGESAGAGNTEQAADSAYPAEESGISRETSPMPESTQEDTAPQTGGESAPLLTPATARTALEERLAAEGRDLQLEPVGLSDDGGSWIFSAKDDSGTSTALFSVARDSGVIREMPAAEPIPNP